MSIDNVIRQLRIKYGYTQESLAKKLGVSKSTISMWENGNRRPTFEDQETIADLFNVTLDYLRGNEEQVFSPVEEIQNELFEQKKLLFDLSNKATPNDLKKIVKIAQAIIGEDE